MGTDMQKMELDLYNRMSIARYVINEVASRLDILLEAKRNYIHIAYGDILTASVKNIDDNIIEMSDIMSANVPHFMGDIFVNGVLATSNTMHSLSDNIIQNIRVFSPVVLEEAAATTPIKEVINYEEDD
jgi:hypothetical protein